MTPPDRSPWDGYVDHFHAHHPGITETVLGACRSRGDTPYRWLADAVSGSGPVRLDLACGSAPLTPFMIGGQAIGVDRSEAELQVASERHPGSIFVRGDASRLPFPERSIDCVASSFALMVLTPLEQVVDELARVTRPGGNLAVLLPTTRPLSMQDRMRYASLTVVLRSSPARFPNPAAGRDLGRVLEARGYRVDRDERVRFSYPVIDEAAAGALVESFYLPDVSDRRREAARRTVRRWIGSDLGIPLRRVLATVDR